MIKICQRCGKEFKTTNSQRKYCSCECSNKSKVIDLTGKRFGNLTVVKLYDKRKRNNGGKEYYWLCKCDCGKKTIVRGATLKNGATQSCGCKQRQIAIKVNTRHGQGYTKLYKVYFSMKQRCLNPKNKAFAYYGGRGIKICNEWIEDYTNFYNWAIANGYKKGLSIDRIDVDGNYEPSNCRWILQAEQVKNTRRNKFITFNGETKTLSEWSKTLGYNRTVIAYRIKAGWSIEKTFTTPTKIKRA